MSEERRAERDRGIAARSGEHPTAVHSVDEPGGEDIVVDEGDSEIAVETQPNPVLAPNKHREKGPEPGTGRRARGRMALRIPDDEITRPAVTVATPAETTALDSSELLPESDAPLGPPITATRIITINPPPKDDVSPADSDDLLPYDPDGPTLHREPPSEALKAAPPASDSALPTLMDVSVHDSDGDELPPLSVEIPISGESLDSITAVRAAPAVVVPAPAPSEPPPPAPNRAQAPSTPPAAPTRGAEAQPRTSRPPSSPDIVVEEEGFSQPDLDEAATPIAPAVSAVVRPATNLVSEEDGELDVDSSARLSEPGEVAEVEPEDVVSVESAPAKVKSGKAQSVRPPAPSSAPKAKAAKPVPPLPVPKPPLVIVPSPSPIAPPPMTEAAAAVRRRARPWWEDLFNDDFIRTMAKITDAQIATEVDFIEESLGVAKGAMILDLACGTGRHAIELTRRGYQVVGFDLSLAMLAKAADEAQDRNQKLNFVQGDMREMTFEDTFDGVYSWNTSFGFFEEEKNEQVIINIRKALKKGGQFLLDVPNRDFVVQQSPSLAWFEGDGCVCMDEMHVDWITSRMRVKRTMMMDDSRTKEIEYSIRIYTLNELGKMLHDYGFRVAEVSGRISTPGVFLGCESPRTLILAERK